MVTSANPLPSGWHHVLVTHDNNYDGRGTDGSDCPSTARAFIYNTNGYTATTCAGSELCVGGYWYNNTVSNGFKGKIDEVRVSSSVLNGPDDYNANQPPVADATPPTCSISTAPTAR